MSKFLNKPRLTGQSVIVGESLSLNDYEERQKRLMAEIESLRLQMLSEVEQQARMMTEQARQEAARILEEAHDQACAEAQRIVQEAEASRDAIQGAAHEAGFQAGFQEGYSEAVEQVEAQTVELLAGAQTILEGAYQAEKLVLKSFQKHAHALVRHVCQKILRTELADSPDKLLGLIEKAVDSLHLSGKVKVVLNPEILQALRQYSAKTGGALEALTRLEFCGDALLEPEQIFVISPEGSFDLSPSEQVRQLTEPLAGKLPLEEMPPAETIPLEALPDVAALTPPDVPADEEAPEASGFSLPKDLPISGGAAPEEPEITSEYVSLEDLLLDEVALDEDEDGEA